MGVRLQIRLFILGCVLPASQLAFGQTLGSIGGETRDSSGAIVAGATVTAVNTGTNATRTLTTNDAGGYSFPSLPPGTYTVKVEKTGFKNVVTNQIELQVQLNARVDFELQIGQVSKSVEVRADAALLVTDNATVGTVIENRLILSDVTADVGPDHASLKHQAHAEAVDAHIVADGMQAHHAAPHQCADQVLRNATETEPA